MASIIRKFDRSDFGNAMARTRQRPRAFTLVELIAVSVIIVLGLIILVPWIQARREQDRRARCLNKVKQIGLAFHNYASTYNSAFPPSAELYKNSTGQNTVGGYSFLVKLLPYLQIGPYSPLPKSVANSDIDVAMAGNPIIAAGMQTSFKEFVCPSNANKLYRSPNTIPPQFAFTNYKAMGASTRNSLLMVSNPSGTPPYGPASLHPDGAIFPSDKNLPLASFADGTSHTIITIETIDDTNSRWMVGAECTLVGLPQASSPTGDKPQEPFNYFAPPGYDGTCGDTSAVAHAGLRTFLTYDFSPRGADAGKYEDPGWAKAPPDYGPSSMHPGVVVVGMADGSVEPLSRKVDAAYFLFMITKGGSDPFYCL